MQCYPSARDWRLNVSFKPDSVDVSHFLAESQMTYINATVLWKSRHCIVLSGCLPLHFVVHPVLSISQISALAQTERSNDRRSRSVCKWLSCFALKIAMKKKQLREKFECSKSFQDTRHDRKHIVQGLESHTTRSRRACAILWAVGSRLSQHRT